MNGPAAPVARLENVTQRYKRAVALDDVTVALPAGCMVGLIGPDGVGKSTLLSMIAGARQVQSGRVLVLDGDMADVTHRNAVCTRIAFMPQGLGKNLYPDLSVRENIEFFGRLFGQSRSERALFVTTTTSYGMLISAFASTQIAALFGTVILTVLPATQFAGMLTPVSSLSGVAKIMGRAFPMTYFVPISVGTFTKGLSFGDLWPDSVALTIFIPVLTTISLLLLRKQER
jgi:hypothetical protein